MKTKLKSFTAIACAAACALSFAACGSPNGKPAGNPDGGTVGESKLLGSPQKVEAVENTALNSEGYKAFKTKVEDFAARFAAASYSAYEKQDNFTVSPVSVYTALALTAECAWGDTQSEILDALGVTHQQLKDNYSTLYRSLEVEYKTWDNKTTGLLDLTNSIWVNDSTPVKQPCIEDLSNYYYTYSYSADFEHNVENANKAVRDFIKKQTRGLIDQDFDLSSETLFALINSLYLKTIWNTDGEDLPFAPDKYDFTAKDGSVKNVQLLQSDYIDGRAVEFDSYSTFYTQTYDGYKIKFILPKDGYSVDQVFTAENIAAVNAITDYNAYDDSNGDQYVTRVLFPEYKCKYNEDIAGILKSDFGIDLLFKDHMRYSPACEFSTLSNESCYCEKIVHVTDLTVDKKGIEGAAVTVVGMAADGAPQITVQQDFVVNKAFGFIITDRNDVTLFSGAVHNV